MSSLVGRAGTVAGGLGLGWIGHSAYQKDPSAITSVRDAIQSLSNGLSSGGNNGLERKIELLLQKSNQSNSQPIVIQPGGDSRYGVTSALLLCGSAGVVYLYYKGGIVGSFGLVTQKQLEEGFCNIRSGVKNCVQMVSSVRQEMQARIDEVKDYINEVQNQMSNSFKQTDEKIYKMHDDVEKVSDGLSQVGGAVQRLEDKIGQIDANVTHTRKGIDMLVEVVSQFFVNSNAIKGSSAAVHQLQDFQSRGETTTGSMLQDVSMLEDGAADWKKDIHL